MALLDDRGRLFGRVNLIDVAAGLLVLLLVALGYASWRLFQTPAPVIASVSPTVILPGQPQTVEVTGQNLRPYLLANVGPLRALYLFETPDRVRVQLPPLAPGQYDMSFYDSKEIARLSNVITVKEPTYAEIRVRFVTRPEILEVVKQAQQEQPKSGRPANPSAPVLVSFDVTDDLVGTTKQDLQEGRMTVIRALVRVPATRSGAGWEAQGFTLKAGAEFTFTAPTYVLEGEILSIETPSDKP
jgi:hypothetical protein